MAMKRKFVVGAIVLLVATWFALDAVAAILLLWSSLASDADP